MMSLIPSTQLLLALWLFAAVLPAATALVNGSVAPFAFGGSESRITQRDGVRSETAKRDTAQEQDDSSLDWLAFESECGATLQPRLAPAGASLCRSGEPLPARSTSVLQTDLQRHRPKLG